MDAPAAAQLFHLQQYSSCHFVPLEITTFEGLNWLTMAQRWKPNLRILIRRSCLGCWCILFWLIQSECNSSRSSKISTTRPAYKFNPLGFTNVNGIIHDVTVWLIYLFLFFLLYPCWFQMARWWALLSNLSDAYNVALHNESLQRST